jgi:magnesium transporter
LLKDLLGIRTKKPGLAPGTLVHIGERQQQDVTWQSLRYSKDSISAEGALDPLAFLSSASPSEVSWLDIVGLHDIKLVEQIGEKLNLHALVLEDILNTSQRPKLESYNDYHFLTCKMLQVDKQSGDLHVEQVSFVVGECWLVSFQEQVGDVFGPVRDRIQSGRVRIRSGGSDYLLYALVDAIVDNYFVALEALAGQLEEIDEKIFEQSGSSILQDLHAIKRELVTVRRAIWPLREAISGLERSEEFLLDQSGRVFLRDLYDHTVHAADLVDALRDVVGGLLEMHVSLVSMRMNEIMKVLTVMASIFIPLTFIAGIYGMNFHYMPELGWRYGYPAVWGLMLVVAVGLVMYLRRREWI